MERVEACQQNKPKASFAHHARAHTVPRGRRMGVEVWRGKSAPADCSRVKWPTNHALRLAPRVSGPTDPRCTSLPTLSTGLGGRGGPGVAGNRRPPWPKEDSCALALWPLQFTFLPLTIVTMLSPPLTPFTRTHNPQAPEAPKHPSPASAPFPTPLFNHGKWTCMAPLETVG